MIVIKLVKVAECGMSRTWNEQDVGEVDSAKCGREDQQAQAGYDADDSMRIVNLNRSTC
jgi:hypothetical protein